GGQAGSVARPLELGRHGFCFRDHFFDRNGALLDGEKAFAKVAFHHEDRRALSKPASCGDDEAKEVVCVLRTELAWKVERCVRRVARKANERGKLGTLEKALIGERTIELFDVLLRLMDRVGFARSHLRRDARKALGDRIERKIGVGTKPFEYERSVRR